MKPDVIGIRGHLIGAWYIVDRFRYHSLTLMAVFVFCYSYAAITPNEQHSPYFSRATDATREIQKYYKKCFSNAAAAGSSLTLKTRLLTTSHLVPGSGNFPVLKYSPIALFKHVEVWDMLECCR